MICCGVPYSIEGGPLLGLTQETTVRPLATWRCGDLGTDIFGREDSLRREISLIAG